MKRILFIVAFTVFLLSACAAGETIATPTNTPAKIVYATPDGSAATPEAGFATVTKLQGVTALLLRSQPDIKSDLAGQVLPGDTGKILGADSSHRWILVQFKDQVGWAPAVLLELTIAQ
jgi:uncharacterized protein YgiM (DUF1202 family)